MNRNLHLRGIVVVADNQEQAMDHFRAVASGNYSVMESKDGEIAIATSENTVGLQIMNPLNGEEMVAVPEENKPEMVAVASAENGTLDAFYVTCASGCGSHVIADKQELLQHCPTCASTLPALEDDALKTQNAQNKPEILLAVANSQEEVAQAYRALATGECETFATDCGGVIVLSNKKLSFDIYQGVAASEPMADYTQQLAVASAEGHCEAHYLVTASAEGTVHVLCSDESPLFCPETSACLVEPETPAQPFQATASDDEDDEEFDDEEEDEDEDESDEEEDDEEEEEDEDDEEEEDEDEDEEDEDDLSLSLANSDKSKAKPKKGGVRRKQKKETAVASATPAEPAAVVPETTEVQASFVSIAASEMSDKSVEVSYAGTIQGQPTWLAFHNGVPFAKAIAKNAENPAMFADESFGRAFKAKAAAEGVPAAIEALRFEEIRPTVAIDKVVATQIENSVQEQAAQLASAANEDVANLSERFEAALATSAQGINRGFFPNITNPIRVALASALEDMGVQGGDVMLQKVFAEHGDEYAKRMLAKASEIMQHDPVVQNQLAEAIHGMQEGQTQATASSAAPVGRPVQTRKPNAQESQQILATASNTGDDLAQFDQKLKSLRF